MVVRGEKIQAESSFLRGNFWRNDHFSVDLSLNAGLNVNSKDNFKRQGMPNIYNTVETGLLFRYFMWSDANKDNMLNLEMPIRSVFVTNFKSLKQIGFFSIPYLNFLARPQAWNMFCATEFSIGPMFASHKMHSYFYKVSENYANAERPYYEPKGGYSGTQVYLSVTKRIKDFLIFPFIRYDFLEKSAFVDSPLVETKRSALYGLGFVYYFAASPKLQRNDYQVK